jgi:hypothetical protein
MVTSAQRTPADPGPVRVDTAPPSEWTPDTCPSGHRAPVQMDPAGAVRTPGSDAAARCCEAGGQRDSAEAGLSAQSSAASVRAARRCQAAALRPCRRPRPGTVRDGAVSTVATEAVCPGMVDPDGRTLLPTGGRGRGRRAGPSRRWAPATTTRATRSPSQYQRPSQHRSAWWSGTPACSPAGVPLGHGQPLAAGLLSQVLPAGLFGDRSA